MATGEADIGPIGVANAAQLNVGSEDNGFFLRHFSDRDGVPYAIIYWKDYALVLGVEKVKSVGGEI